MSIRTCFVGLGALAVVLAFAEDGAAQIDHDSLSRVYVDGFTRYDSVNGNGWRRRSTFTNVSSDQILHLTSLDAMVLDPEELGFADIWGVSEGPSNNDDVRAAAAAAHPTHHLWGGNWFESENPQQVEWQLTEFEGISFPLDLGPGESFTLTSVVHNNIFGPSNRVELKEFDFSGVVNSVNDPGSLLGGSVVPGTPFSGTWRQDPATPDGNPDPRAGFYLGAIDAWTIDVGGNSFEAFGNDDIFVEDGDGMTFPPQEWDSYHQQVDLKPAFGPGDGFAAIDLQDPMAIMFEDDALPEDFFVEVLDSRDLYVDYLPMTISGSVQSISPPTTIPPRTEYDDRGEFVIGYSFSGSQSTIPAPSTLVGLLGMGVMGLMAYAWRRGKAA